jgi:hypothetical protein
MMSADPSIVARSVPTARAPWIVPSVTDLPKLTDLTLQTGSIIPGDADTGGSGSTVIP